jgi:hypothetical protein
MNMTLSNTYLYEFVERVINFVLQYSYNNGVKLCGLPENYTSSGHKVSKDIPITGHGGP